MQNYPKILIMSVVSSFEYNIKNRCQDFYDKHVTDIEQNYPKIKSIKRLPVVDQMYNKIVAYNGNDGIEHLDASGFYEFFHGEEFKKRIQGIFMENLQQAIIDTEEQIKKLEPLMEISEQYGFDYVKQNELKLIYEKCTFDDAERAFLSLKLRRNRLAHDYINGLTDTFMDIQNFYVIAVIYVISLERAIAELSDT